MKRFWKVFSLAGLILLASCSGEFPGYTITGHVSGADSTAVRLEMREDGQWIALDSTMARDGKFTFSGQVSHPEMVYVKFLQPGGSPVYVPVFLENRDITLSGRMDSLDDATITGSPAHDDYVAFLEGLEPLYATYDSLYSLLQGAAPPLRDSLEHLITALEDEELAFTKRFVNDHRASPAAAYIVLRQLAYRLEYGELLELVESLDQPASSKYMTGLRESLDRLQYLVTGAEAPHFTETDTAGQSFRLDSMRGKYVLLDFWASWCGPCRRENPEMVRLYEAFRGKDFEIVGISLDKDRDRWLDAIESDGLEWIHVSDLQGWKCAVAEQYHVKAIPQTYLLDREGRILNKGLRGGALFDRLSELLPAEDAG